MVAVSAESSLRVAEGGVGVVSVGRVPVPAVRSIMCRIFVCARCSFQNKRDSRQFRSFPNFVPSKTMVSDYQSAQGSMLISSLPPDTPQDHILDWDESTVHAFFSVLGYPHYKSQLLEHGISGEILVHLDHQGLKDVGVHSVGQRLAVLKGVYTLKIRDDVPIEEGHWVPPSDDVDPNACDSPLGAIPPKRLISMFRERDDRIALLESRLQQFEKEFGRLRHKTTPSRSGGRNGKSHSNHAHTISSGTNSSLNTEEHATSFGTHSPEGGEDDDEEGTLRTGSRFHQQQLGFSSSPTSPAVSPGFKEDSLRVPLKAKSSMTNLGMQLPAVNISSGPVITKDFTPLTVTPGVGSEKLENPMDKVLPLPLPALSTSFFPATSSPAPPTTANGTTNGTSSSSVTPTPGSSFLNSTLSPVMTTASIVTPMTAAHDPHSVSPPTAGPSVASSTSSTETARPPLGRSVSKHSAENPYKSFRVTLDDPCHKVLPAALKKYKINDDWKQYALFILFGPPAGSVGKERQERCLAYDEKPLLLFQKLKETDQNPVFMLRHIKDIKSPIAVAAAKHESKKSKQAQREKEQKDLSKPAYSRANRLHHAPAAVLQPVGDMGELQSPSSARVGGSMGREDDGKMNGAGEVLGYCLAIYPYVAEREDEFDVAVGDTFAIVNKAKGWWVVYRDNGPGGPMGENEVIKSAWVPAGCLLETAVAPLRFATPDQIMANGPANARNVLVPPISIISVSTPGVALMDYKPKGSEEVEMRKDERLRVYKRYNHWSYLCNESTGERGWVPSWFVGKVYTGGNVPPTPTVATSDARGRNQDETSGGSPPSRPS
ncbi:RA-domain-containing protein [Atractiella rhizophila]|nr:RA-domain-containing protein [Atractiella rhizophila]